jgi:hypothetical protein
MVVFVVVHRMAARRADGDRLKGGGWPRPERAVDMISKEHIADSVAESILSLVCTENLNTNVVVLKSTKDRV